MKHRIYRMTKSAWDKGTEWDDALYNGDIETVKEFDSLDKALEYWENECGHNTEMFGIE